MWSLLVCVILFTTVSTVKSDRNQLPQIPLTKCCRFEENETYSILDDQCIHLNKPGLKQDQQFPEVFSMDGIVTRSLSIAPERFTLTHELFTCPYGYFVNRSSSFVLLENGSLLTHQTKRNIGEYCVDQVSVDPDTDPIWIARYCVPDPCLRKPCIRKCCPNGMIIDSNHMCSQSSPSINFAERLRNESVVAIDPSLSFVSYGVSIPNKCENEIAILQPYRSKKDAFNLLSDGRMVMLHSVKDEQLVGMNESYCIDYMQSSESYVELVSFTCFPPQPERSVPSHLVSYLLLFSSFFLVATFIVYCLIPELRNIPGLCVMCHVASLAVTYLGLATIQLASHLENGVCIAMATIVHFSFLSVFTWLNVMSFGLWWTFRDMRPMTNPRSGPPQLGWRMIFYSLYGWAIPMIFVLTGFMLDNVEDLPENIIRPRFGVSGKCWFDDRKAYIAYLFGPIALLISSNILFFIMTLYQLYRTSNDLEYARVKHRTMNKCRIIFGLFLLMGVSWMWEIISFVAGGNADHWLITDVLNILTGVFIFFTFVCKPKVWELLKLNYPRLEALDPWCPAFLKIRGGKNESNNDEPQTAVSSIKSKSTSTAC